MITTTVIFDLNYLKIPAYTHTHAQSDWLQEILQHVNVAPLKEPIKLLQNSK